MSCPTDVGIYVSKSCDCRPIVKRRAFTLVELLVSVTLTLLVVFAIVQIFDVLGSNMRLGRALIEMSGQMRTVTNRLQQDLDNVTCQVKPWNDPESGSGYFMFIERNARDQDAMSFDADGNSLLGPDGQNDAADAGQSTHFGDWDDVLALTVRSPDRPFVGRMVTTTGGVTTIQSQEAEVVWWTAVVDTDGDGNIDPTETNIVLLRRIFLIAPNLQNAINSVYAGGGTLNVALSDLSVHAETGQPPITNTLADLSRPDLRAVAQRSDVLVNNDLVYEIAFPTVIAPSDIPGDSNHSLLGVLDGSQSQSAANDQLNVGVAFGDYVVLTDTLAFDIRAYDPLAPIISVNGIAIAPGDPGYPPPQNANDRAPLDDLRNVVGIAIDDIPGPITVSTAYGSAEMIGRGAYVDLGYLLTWNYGGPDGPRLVFTSSHSDLSVIGNSFDPDERPLGRVSHFSGLPAFRDMSLSGTVGFRDPGEPFWRLDNGLLENTAARAYNLYHNVDVPTIYYDTWTSFYERDGENQDFDELTDEGTDGLDNSMKANGNHDLTGGAAINGVDDPTERETSPPLPC